MQIYPMKIGITRVVSVDPEVRSMYFGIRTYDPRLATCYTSLRSAERSQWRDGIAIKHPSHAEGPDTGMEAWTPPC